MHVVQSIRRRADHRRIIGLAVVAATAVLLSAPTAEARGGFEHTRLTVTGWQRQAATGLPLPNAGDGIGPGSYLLIDQTDGNSYICTANFVWNGVGAKYLGAAGHCFLPEGVQAAPTSNPGKYVTRVQVCVSDCLFGGQLGAVIEGTFVTLGPVAYARQEQGAGNDVGHDFGLVTIPAGTAGVRTSLPVWGGPTGEGTIRLGQPVCLYGNAAGLGEVFATKARAGLGSSTHDGAWFANMPSAPGDSGSAVVNCPGLTGTTAVGILTHLATDGTGVIAGTTVAQAKAMFAADTGKSITLATA
jgi:hypothetical protein